MKSKNRNRFSQHVVKMLVVLCFSWASICYSQVESDIYSWLDTEEVTESFGSIRNILAGETRDFSSLIVTGITLNSGFSGPQIAEASEVLILAKSGVLNVKVSSASHELGPGSAVLLLPGESVQISNASEEAVEYFVLEFISRAPVDLERGRKAGGSKVFTWDDLQFNPHDKGGVRKYFDRSTAMSSRFEMHTTTLIPGLKSHEPHTHQAAEIILMIEGETEEQIGNDFHKGMPGDFYYLESEVSHAIENIGEQPATYYAFQFE